MTEPTRESVRAEREAQEKLVSDLRAAGEGGRADRLAGGYHAQRMADLAADVYVSARGEGKPPVGWTRASEHPEMLQALAPGLDRRQIDDMLHPQGSGYRAEVYLPDKSVLGPDAKPVLVFKGSTGLIVDPSAPGGKRESAAEDFLANNVPQGLGLKTDYYDRAMDAATRLKGVQGFQFEIAGHSLGGGMASAAGAVTGVETTTFNAAGLHANTAKRYADEHGLQVYDTKRNVDAYQVGGEMLTDGQTGIQKLDAARRAEAGRLANDVTSLMAQPGAREFVAGKLSGMLPPEAQKSAMGAIDYLSTHSGNQALKHLPTAAGELQPLLSPKTRDEQGRLVNRPDQMALSELGAYAGPLTDVLSATAMSARVGRNVGEVVKAQGQATEQGLHVVGQGLNYTAQMHGQANAFVTGTTGKVVSSSVSATGELTAQVRLQGGNLSAGIDHVQGKAQETATSWTASAMRWAAKALPDDAEKWVGRQAQGIESYGKQAMQHNEQQARQAQDAARRDATGIRQGAQGLAGRIDHGATVLADAQREGGRQAGAWLQQGADGVGHTVRGVTDKAPLAGTVVGGTVGGVGSTVATHLPVNVQNTVNLYNTITVLQNGKQVAGEAVFRHGMVGSVIPSLDASVQQQEQAARKALAAHPQQPDAQAPATRAPEGVAPPRAPVTPISTPPLLDDPAHPSHALFRDAQKGVHAIDQRFNRAPDAGSDRLAGALTAEARNAGFTQIGRVELSRDASRIFAVDTPDPNAAHQRVAYTGVQQGIQQPLAVSTEQVDRANARLAEAPAQQPTQQQGEPARGTPKVA